jgi:uncharacterized protein (DUF1697 family)
MDSLRQVFESLGFSSVETFIASGNVAFNTRAKNAKLLERKIEKRLRKAMGYDVDVFIRTNAELEEIASFEPFRQSQIRSIAAGINIIFLKEALDRRSKRDVLALKTNTDEFRVCGREIYWLRRRKPDKPIFSTVPLEKALRGPFTIRGANTVMELAAKYFVAN